MANWVKNIRAVLLDINGTIQMGDKPTRQAIQALKRLRQNGIAVRFITNATKISRRRLHAKLNKLGFDINLDEIFTALTAARRLVEVENLRPFYLLQDEAKEDFEGLETANPNAIVIGLAPDIMNYESLNKAFRLLVENNDCRIIAMDKGRYYKRAEGLTMGPGPFVEALEYASGKEALVVGKPDVGFFKSALREFDCLPEETVMIGDDISLDVLGALNANIGGILVKTGKYLDGDENHLKGLDRCLCMDDFASAVDAIITATSNTTTQAQTITQPATRTGAQQIIA